MSRVLDQALWNLPNASGSTVSTPSPSAALTRVLAKALDLMREMGDDYAATEHLLLALVVVDNPVQPVAGPARRRRGPRCARRSRPCGAPAR
jgi:ATP-dependent Clp protease ATP-binding subunit ClpB